MDQDQEREIRRIVAEELGRLSEGFAGVGHVHDGFDAPRVLIGDLEPDSKSRGAVPFNYAFVHETTPTTLDGSDQEVASLTLSVRSRSNVLYMVTIDTDNDAATSRTLTYKAKDGSTVIDTWYDYLPSGAGSYSATPHVHVYNPAVSGDFTLSIIGSTSSGSPVTEEVHIFMLELPFRLSDTT